MNILVDTQILVWSFDSNSQISARHKKILEDTANRIFVSQISLMELAIKKNINKLPEFIPDIKSVAEQFLSFGFELMPLSNEQIFAYQQLPLFADHKDPFDRFLIAIAKHENLTIVSSDTKFKLYDTFITVID